MNIIRMSALLAISLSAASVAQGDWINVKNWSTNASLNALGDGINNDSPRIQAAIDSVSNGAILYFPAGTYKLGATTNNGSTLLQHHALRIANKKITITGDGAASILLQTNPATTLMWGYFTNRGDAGFTVKNIKFQGDTNTAISYSSDLYASGCLLAIAAYGAGGDVFTGYNSRGIRVQNVTFDEHGKRIALLLDGIDDVVVESCSFIHYRNSNGNAGDGYPSISVAPGGVGSLRIVNNYHNGHFDSPTGSTGSDGLLYQQAGVKTVMSGNTIVNQKLEALQSAAKNQVISGNIIRSLKDAATGIIITPNHVWTGTNIQVTVSDNVVDGVGVFIHNNGVHSDESRVKIDLNVINNTVRLGAKEVNRTGGWGISLDRGHRVTIQGNTIDNFATGVWLSGTGLDDSIVSIQGNTFSSCTSSNAWVNIIVNRGYIPLTHNTFFRNISILNNFLSGGSEGNIYVDRANIPTTGPTANVPGRLLIGNNIYVNTNNVTQSKWIRVDGSNVVTASTNLGGYSVVDLNP